MGKSKDAGKTKSIPSTKMSHNDIDDLWMAINELKRGMIFMHEELDKLTDVVDAMSDEMRDED
jgi:hypothetical protein